MIIAEFNRIERDARPDATLNAMNDEIEGRVLFPNGEGVKGNLTFKTIFGMAQRHDPATGPKGRGIQYDITDRARFHLKSYDRDVGQDTILFAKNTPYWGKQNDQDDNRFNWSAGYRYFFNALVLNQIYTRVLISDFHMVYQNPYWGPPVLKIHKFKVIGAGAITEFGSLSKAIRFPKSWFTPEGLWANSECSYLANEKIEVALPSVDASGTNWSRFVHAPQMDEYV